MYFTGYEMCLHLNGITLIKPIERYPFVCYAIERKHIQESHWSFLRSWLLHMGFIIIQVKLCK